MKLRPRQRPVVSRHNSSLGVTHFDRILTGNSCDGTLRSKESSFDPSNAQIRSDLFSRTFAGFSRSVGSALNRPYQLPLGR